MPVISFSEHRAVPYGGCPPRRFPGRLLRPVERRLAGRDAARRRPPTSASKEGRPPGLPVDRRSPPSTNPISAGCRRRPTRRASRGVDPALSLHSPATRNFTLLRDGHQVVTRPTPADQPTAAPGAACWPSCSPPRSTHLAGAATDRPAPDQGRDARHHPAARQEQPLRRSRRGQDNRFQRDAAAAASASRWNLHRRPADPDPRG